MKNKSLTNLNLKEDDLSLIYGKKKQIITTSEDAYKLLKKHFDKSDINKIESFKILLLNENLEVIKVSDISQGDKRSCYISMKNMFKEILINNAESIVICHNHPSKMLVPTSADNELTREVQSVCNSLGINLQDHIILSSGGYYSYLHDDEK